MSSLWCHRGVEESFQYVQRLSWSRSQHDLKIIFFTAFSYKHSLPTGCCSTSIYNISIISQHHRRVLWRKWWLEERYRKKWNFQLTYFDQPVKCFFVCFFQNVGVGRDVGVDLCTNSACLFQFGVLLSSRIITHPLLLNVLGLRQQIPCLRQPTRWIKTKANLRLLLSFSPLLISLALILNEPSSLLNEPLQGDELSL